MKIEKSLEEVRSWKEKIYEKDKNLSNDEIIKKIQMETLELKKKLNLPLCASHIFHGSK